MVADPLPRSFGSDRRVERTEMKKKRVRESVDEREKGKNEEGNEEEGSNHSLHARERGSGVGKKHQKKDLKERRSPLPSSNRK